MLPKLLVFIMCGHSKSLTIMFEALYVLYDENDVLLPGEKHDYFSKMPSVIMIPIYNIENNL